MSSLLPQGWLLPFACEPAAPHLQREVPHATRDHATRNGEPCPEQFRFDELIRQGLSARNDPSEVVVDPHARYFGAELGERSLIPAAERLGEIPLAGAADKGTR